MKAAHANLAVCLLIYLCNIKRMYPYLCKCPQVVLQKRIFTTLFTSSMFYIYDHLCLFIRNFPGKRRCSSHINSW